MSVRAVPQKSGRFSRDMLGPESWEKSPLNGSDVKMPLREGWDVIVALV